MRCIEASVLISRLMEDYFGSGEEEEEENGEGEGEFKKFGGTIEIAEAASGDDEEEEEIMDKENGTTSVIIDPLGTGEESCFVIMSHSSVEHGAATQEEAFNMTLRSLKACLSSPSSTTFS